MDVYAPAVTPARRKAQENVVAMLRHTSGDMGPFKTSLMCINYPAATS
jgi:hypothetical protein